MGRRELGLLIYLAVLWAVLAVAVSLRLGMEKRMEEVSAVAALENRMASLEAESIEKQLKIAKWYNYQLEQGKYLSERDYQSIWNLGQGQMGLFSVPELELAVPITHGIGGRAGHDPASALPTGGREEQTVLYLQVPVLWREGMELRTVLPGAETVWQVESIQRMPPNWPADHPGGTALLTIVYDRGNTRTIVRCRPGTTTANPAPEPETVGKQALLWGISPLFLIPVLWGTGKILCFFTARRRQKAVFVTKLVENARNQPKSVFPKI